ncbi:MAG TPA: YraN family protein [Verrucomicrobiales bacterium]|nr:YraN family protein [Verrucomicrobiales bacterium]HIL72410.1 YraN family protein [Verrucomicrobiota bacterium]
MKSLRGFLKFDSESNHSEKPIHLVRGELGEKAAEKHLISQGLIFLMRNFKSKRGEIDLIFRDDDCLVFIEVKTRSSGSWTRPAAAVNAEKKRKLTRAAFDYLTMIKRPQIKMRFDIVEVILAGDQIQEIRHLPVAFNLTKPYRYG